ncbi:MAG: ABC transporter permease, partial [Ilumatobacteraceae bacterium]|nr:ABC transporter permease [Ilumatobacteraceae bacterium]
LEIPGASPAIFAGLRVSAGLAVIGAIVGDFFFSRGTPGLGRLVTYFFQDTRSGPMFVTALVAAFLGLGFFLLVELLRSVLVSPWHQN